MIVYLLILLLQTVLLDAASIHTGFCVGAFWGTAQTPKTKADFLRQFNLAKNLPDVPVSFNSVRLFTSQQHNTRGTPSEAFEAAIETNTTLLLGFWASAFEDEKVALGAAFAKHGKKLADLVVGISVGNEDILRNQPDCKQAPGNKPCVEGQSPETIKKMIRETEIWLKQDFSDLFEERPPVGHTDTAAFAILDHVDYNGATIYPYWHGDKVADANQSFFQTLADLTSRSGEIPVWITETGWPYAGPNSRAAIANSANAQEYWKTVGCSIFGKYNTWWFQLESDSTDGPDWGIIDAQTQKPRFDLRCPGVPSLEPSPSITSQDPSLPSQTSLQSPSTFITLASSSVPGLSSSVLLPSSIAISSSILQSPSVPLPSLLSSSSSTLQHFSSVALNLTSTLQSPSPPQFSTQVPDIPTLSRPGTSAYSSSSEVPSPPNTGTSFVLSTAITTGTIISIPVPPSPSFINSSASTSTTHVVWVTDTVTITVPPTPTLNPSMPSPPANSTNNSSSFVVSSTAMPISTPNPSSQAPTANSTSTSTSTPETVTTTVLPTSTLILTQIPSPTKVTVTWETIADCITVSDTSGNGSFIPIATNPAGPDGKCTWTPQTTPTPPATAKPSIPAATSTLVSSSLSANTSTHPAPSGVTSQTHIGSTGSVVASHSQTGALSSGMTSGSSAVGVGPSPSSPSSTKSPHGGVSSAASLVSSVGASTSKAPPGVPFNLVTPSGVTTPLPVMITPLSSS